MKDLLKELRRRKVFRVAVLYVVVGWLVVQVADATFPHLNLPGWSVTLVIGLTALGFPVALVVAWAFEITPEGVRRAEGPARDPARGPDEARSGSRRALQALGALAVAAAAVAGGWYLLGAGGEPEAPRIDPRSVAVLPLEDISPREGDAYFADGLHEEVIAQLAAIDDLKVISRTSVMEYRDSPKNLREIAAELGVRTVLEGSVRFAGDRIRVTAQLIDAATDEHLWAESYDRRLADVFAIQSDVARQIAAALDAELSPEEERRIERRPTDDPEAYTYYLQANDYFRRVHVEGDLRTAETLYERAVGLDPGFAEAWAKLVRLRSWLHFGHNDPGGLERAEEALERLRALGPDLDATHVAEGWYAYYGERDFGRAIRELEIVRRRQPGNTVAIELLALLQRRVGRWEEHLETMRRLVELDPRDSDHSHTLGGSLMRLRRFGEARPHLERAISLAPDVLAYHEGMFELMLRGHGDTARAREVVKGAAAHLDADDLAWLRAQDALWRGEFAGAHRLAVSQPLDGPFERFVAAATADRAGREDAARAHADTLEALAEEMLRSATRRGDVPGMAIARYFRGAARVFRGRGEKAVEDGERALELFPLDADAVAAPRFAYALVWIYARTGRRDEAVALLGRLLEVPSLITVHRLRIDPLLDPLRDHPGFRELLERGGAGEEAGADPMA